MRKVLSSILFGVYALSLVLAFWPHGARANFFEQSTYPVEYDQPRQLGRAQKTDSIDQCLARKEFFFNEFHNIWVKGLVRCKYNSKGILSAATYGFPTPTISTNPQDEQRCFQKRDGEIIVNGTPSEEEARRWSERCSYLGTVGGAGPIGTYDDGNFSDYFGSEYALPTGDGGVPIDVATGKPKEGSLYTGPGVQVPSKDLVPKGISTETSLSNLIVFYTNATLPYVSVLSIFVFVAAGIYYIISFTNEELQGKAKTMMIYVVIGILIIFSAYTIVNTLLRFTTG